MGKGNASKGGEGRAPIWRRILSILCCRHDLADNLLEFVYILNDLLMGTLFQRSRPDFCSARLNILKIYNMGSWLHTGKRWLLEDWSWPCEKELLCDFQWYCENCTRDTTSLHHRCVYSFFRPPKLFYTKMGGPCPWFWGCSGHQTFWWRQRPAVAGKANLACKIFPRAKCMHSNSRSHVADKSTGLLSRYTFSKFSQNWLAGRWQITGWYQFCWQPLVMLRTHTHIYALHVCYLASKREQQSDVNVCSNREKFLCVGLYALLFGPQFYNLSSLYHDS